MSVQTLKLGGKRYVVLEELEYRRLLEEMPEVAMPAPDANGNYPALEAIKVSIARDILRSRRRLGLTQVELARRAGIRPETLNRIEQGKTSPGVATIEKIDRALRKAETEDRE